MRSKLFKVFNVVTAMLCVGVILFNSVNVDVRSSEQAMSAIGDDQFEYKSAEDSFSFKKNGCVVGRLRTNGKTEIIRGGLMLNCNAVVVGAKTVASAGAAGAAGAVAGAAAPTAALSAVGFGGSGVIAGSAAAAAQSAIGNVAAGSLFAKLTAAGFAAATPAVIVPAAVIGAVAALGVA